MKITVRATPKTYAQQAAAVLAKMPDMAGNHPQPAQAPPTMGAKVAGDMGGDMAKLRKAVEKLEALVQKGSAKQKQSRTLKEEWQKLASVRRQ